MWLIPTIRGLACSMSLLTFASCSVLPPMWLRESHICGMSCQVPTLEEAIQTEKSPGDGFWAAWLVASGCVTGPAAEAADDPGKPSQARSRVWVLQLFCPTFETTVEGGQGGLVCRI